MNTKKRNHCKICKRECVGEFCKVHENKEVQERYFAFKEKAKLNVGKRNYKEYLKAGNLKISKVY